MRAQPQVPEKDGGAKKQQPEAPFYRHEELPIHQTYPDLASLGASYTSE